MGLDRLFAAGGVVMWPLLACSILTLALIVERSRFWYRIYKRQNRVVREALKLYRLDDPVSAIAKLRENANLPIPRIFLSALELERPTPEKFRLALESEAQAEIPILRRFQTVLETIVGLAPLLGLLGTVLGLILSFRGLNIGDVGGTKTTTVSAGISEALVSTATGMVVAIFTLIAVNTFRAFYQRQLALIQEYGGQLEILYRDRYEGEEKTYATTR
jgi:biopolymer transport protein ExbB